MGKLSQVFFLYCAPQQQNSFIGLIKQQQHRLRLIPELCATAIGGSRSVVALNYIIALIKTPFFHCLISSRLCQCQKPHTGAGN